MCLFVCFKQKTAYEMRISSWSSDVCSSDLERLGRRLARHGRRGPIGRGAAEEILIATMLRRSIGQSKAEASSGPVPMSAPTCIPDAIRPLSVGWPHPILAAFRGWRADLNYPESHCHCGFAAALQLGNRTSGELACHSLLSGP